MKLQIISPLRMQWEAAYKAIMPDAIWSDKASEGFDTYLHMWCDEDTVKSVRDIDARHIVFIRRYEWYAGHWAKINWDRVDKVIFVNDYLADQFRKATGVEPVVIYNGIDPAKWTYKERSHGYNIAWVGFINQKKNLPLALQILSELPDVYTLHVAGEIQDLQVYDYLCNLAPSIKRRVILHGKIPHEKMDWWLEDKNYLLSTAISEGCPNNVIEAMAKGIKPIVHNWPGSGSQFHEFQFDTVRRACEDIADRGDAQSYNSSLYRQTVIDKFGMDNYNKVKEIVCGQ